MAQYPSKIAVTLAVKRVTRGIQNSMETQREGIEAGLKLAVNYDGPKIVQKLMLDVNGITMNYETAKDYWNKLNA